MSGLLFLSANDFRMMSTPKGNVMGNTIPGFSLILFYSTRCKHCQSIIPVFKKLPGTVNNCQFGMINVTQNRQCIEMSKGSLTELKYVPYILLYYNGKPLVKYAGPPDIQTIAKFVFEMAKTVQNKQPFTNKTNPAIANHPAGGLPKYSIGKPLYGDDDGKKCYLVFNSAYGATANKLQDNRGVRNHLPDASGMGKNI